MKKKRAISLCIVVALTLGLLLTSCGAEKKNENAELVPLPAPEFEVTEENMFGVDKNINQETIDNWLFRSDVAYRDMRMLYDPAEYAQIGGEADLTQTIEGFKVVPYPFIATLQGLPVANAYTGDKLFEVVWTSDGHVESIKPLYEESMMIMEDLFPKDKAIFLMCGGGGYANMTREVLIALGWDSAKLYNTGANWTYQGNHAKELLIYSESKDGHNTLATWRADYAYIDFAKLNKLN